MAVAETDKPRYTAEQFYAMIPETSHKVELINGEIVSDYSLDELVRNRPSAKMLAGASEDHQDISGGLYSEFRSFIQRNKGKCKTFHAPFDVELDEYNTVQPDVFVFCDRNKVTSKRAYGAPDLVVEVVSSNKSDDYNRKLALYQMFGVREYWIVDPFEKRTIVYLFGKTGHFVFYDFDKPVPVGIWDGELEVTIAELLW